jgi:hypothetical protein
MRKEEKQGKKKLRDLSDTPFSGPRLIIWGLFINLVLVILGIIVLSITEKEVMPLGTIAGAIVGYFTGKGMEKDKVKCGVCGTSATYHTTEQCIQLVDKLKKDGLR